MFRFPVLAIALLAAPASAEDSVAVMKAQLEVQRANVKLAEATLDAAKRSFQRISQLKASGTVSNEEFDKAKQDADIAAAQVEVKRAEALEADARLKERDGGAKAAGAKIAVFNMAAVMRDFEKAKYQVHLLNVKRSELSGPILKKRDELIALQKDISEEMDPKNREKQIAAFTALQQKLAADDAALNKKMNEDASKIISGLYDDIKAEVDAIAKAEGLSLVLAYPDAVTAEEQGNPYLKELKLKPPAAIPFFVAKDLDITAAVIKKLNADHPALDKDGKKVDVNKLPAVPMPAPPVPKP